MAIEIEDKLAAKYQLTRQGDAHYFLKKIIRNTNQTFTLKQTGYITDMVLRFKDHVATIPPNPYTPHGSPSQMDHVPASRIPDADVITDVPYRELVGYLIHAPPRDSICGLDRLADDSTIGMAPSQTYRSDGSRETKRVLASAALGAMVLGCDDEGELEPATNTTISVPVLTGPSASLHTHALFVEETTHWEIALRILAYLKDEGMDLRVKVGENGEGVFVRFESWRRLQKLTNGRGTDVGRLA
ncbi:hypothetical protein DFS34DRAFT_93190 [Phlyctochytrium arcticum]|nr:hypothetical protein DFS34DRAFT_93190 [Phlyctochytrium arcticum]